MKNTEIRFVLIVLVTMFLMCTKPDLFIRHKDYNLDLHIGSLSNKVTVFKAGFAKQKITPVIVEIPGTMLIIMPALNRIRVISLLIKMVMENLNCTGW